MYLLASRDAILNSQKLFVFSSSSLHCMHPTSSCCKSETSKILPPNAPLSTDKHPSPKTSHYPDPQKPSPTNLFFEEQTSHSPQKMIRHSSLVVKQLSCKFRHRRRPMMTHRESDHGREPIMDGRRAVMTVWWQDDKTTSSSRSTSDEARGRSRRSTYCRMHQQS